MADLWPVFGQVLTVVGSVTAGIIGSWFVLRGKKVDQEVAEASVEAETTGKFLDGQIAFQKYVDDAVNRRVEEATVDMRQQLDEIAARLVEVQRESHEMNNVIRSRETRLHMWNLMGRTDEMPRLPEAVMERLGIGHLNHLSAFTPPSDTM